MGGSHSSGFPGGGSEGYQVLRVHGNSPGQIAGFEPFFDFIISVSDTRLNTDNDLLKEVLMAHVEMPVQMLVYSSKTQCVRETSVTPSTLWGGQGLLGLTIRFGSFEGVNEHVWHILKVYPHSPAAAAGLRAHTDYIIGADTSVKESEELFSLIQRCEGKQLKLYVYNTDTDNSREVLITPDSEWGGKGSLGCHIGHGYLHRIPTLLNSISTESLPQHQSNFKEVTLSGVSAVDPSSTSVSVSSEPEALSRSSLTDVPKVSSNYISVVELPAPHVSVLQSPDQGPSETPAVRIDINHEGSVKINIGE
ncbi:unnamed protein product [Knipowitschia caucasica]|uniref:PDZ GRASP-type domain-containing protein n=1 Tax=Knipowitschia caucasica TaxID=637954 RepID=A0AAV2K1J1_KNICA